MIHEWIACVTDKLSFWKTIHAEIWKYLNWVISLSDQVCFLSYSRKCFQFHKFYHSPFAIFVFQFESVHSFGRRLPLYTLHSVSMCVYKSSSQTNWSNANWAQLYADPKRPNLKFFVSGFCSTDSSLVLSISRFSFSMFFFAPYFLRSTSTFFHQLSIHCFLPV